MNESGTSGILRTENYNGGINGSTSVNDGNWFFVSSISAPNSADISNILHYVNGNLETTSDLASRATNTQLSSKFVIGRRNLQATSDLKFFQGLIDDVRIYDRALSAAEVQALYNLGQ